MEFSLPGIYAIAGIPIALILYRWSRKHGLWDIPTVGGSSFPLLSYFGSFDNLTNARSLLEEGYDKYKGGTFKIPMPDRWLVVVTGARLVDELQRLPDDSVSFVLGAGELIATRYIFGKSLEEDPYHVEIIQKQLTRNITSMFGELHNEICLAAEDIIPALPHDWVALPALSTMEALVARASSRVFVGPQYCRNPDYLRFAVNFARGVSRARRIVGMFPPFLKRFVAKFVTNIDVFIDEGMALMGPTIVERRNNVVRHETGCNDSPVDMLQWLTEAAVIRDQSPEEIVRRVLMMNFASIFTTSTSLTHALLHLAAEPTYVEMLRDEIEPVIAAEGWSKTSLNKMRKLDSFLRESQRYNGTNLVSLTRMSLKDLKLSDGTFIPAGTLVVVPAMSTHRDSENYQDSNQFDPLRFANLRNKDKSGNGGVKYQFVATSVDYLGFGHGKHACPGRFFASSELKSILAHLVLNYDIKLEHEGPRPQNLYNAFVVVPDPTANVLFKKRSV